MFSWLTQSRSLEPLQKELRRLQHKTPVLPAARKKHLRGRILSRIEASMAREEISFDQLASELERLTLSIEPPLTLGQRTRTRLLDSFKLRRQRVWVQQAVDGFWSRRRFASFAMACLVLVVSTFGYLNQFPVVSASKTSTVLSVQGFVSINNASGLFPLQNGDLLQEGDTLMTGGDGWVDVLFADDTLFTVGPNTEVTLTRLFSDPVNQAKTSIEVTLAEGRVWAHVVNLLSNGSSFAVSVGEAQFFTDRKSTFDVWATPERVEARNFSNLLEFASTTDGSLQEGTLGPSLALVLDGEQPLKVEQIVSMEALADQDVWVQTNLYKEEDHAGDLTATYQMLWEEQTGVLPDSPFYWIQRGVEDVQLWMTFSDESRSQRAVALADRRFSEAALLTLQGNSEEARDAWSYYQETLQAVSDEFSYEAVQSILESNQKVIEAVSTDASFYEARDIVDGTSLLLAPDASTKAEIQLDTATDRLGLALDLIDIGAYDLALESLQDYQIQFGEVMDQLPGLEMEQRKEVILKILDQKLVDLQMLKLIAGRLETVFAVPSEEGDAVAAQWEDIYADTLYQLNTMVLSLKERAVLHLGTFLKDVKGDAATQSEILARLKKSVPLELEFMQLINDLEALYAEESTNVLIVDDTLVTPQQDYIPSAEMVLPQDQEVRAN